MVFVSFIWHMHQPYYKDDIQKKYLASWVRLHASKDYIDMLRIAQNNNAKVTFNLTPVLINQILSYKDLECENTASLLLRNVSDLNDKQKLFFLEDSFKVGSRIIQRMPKYRQLYHKKQNANSNVLNVFSDDEILTCQIAYLLAWFGDTQRDDTVKKIEENLSTAGEDEKRYLLQKQLQILNSIVPEYKKAFKNNEICITTTPFYHPILPLLIDSDIAKVSNPSIKLPERFSYKDDAKWHIKTAKQYMERIFETTIDGMWPSEGSVSDEALCLIAECGFKFAATDEQILKNSGFNNIYMPYLYERDNYKLHMFFRDHTLSDKIGFVYSRMNYKDAVADFVNSVKFIESQNEPKSIVSVILDGENAWEYYDNNGYDFLNHLYDTLQKDSNVELITPNEYLELFNAKELKLNKIWPGSWIGANFNIWIGEDEDNKAWDLLNKARRELSSNKASMQELYKAQGSDWNWWYGSDHSSTDDYLFDNLFRSILIKSYLLAKRSVPEELYMPIKKGLTMLEAQLPIGFINPKIDGFVSSYFEWSGAAEVIDLESAMSVSDRIIKKLFYGFNEDYIFLRVDFNKESNILGKYTISIEIFDNIKTRIVLSKDASYIQKFDRNAKVVFHDNFTSYALNKILELKISKDVLGVHEKEKVYMHVLLEQSNILIERFPIHKDILMEIPSKNFEFENWFV